MHLSNKSNQQHVAEPVYRKFHRAFFALCMLMAPLTRNPLKQKHMSAALREGAMALMRLKAEQWQLELAWGQALRERILSRLKRREEVTEIPGEEA